MQLLFEEYVMKKGRDFVRQPAKNWLELPIKERTRLLINREVEFVKDGEPVSYSLAFGKTE